MLLRTGPSARLVVADESGASHQVLRVLEELLFEGRSLGSGEIRTLQPFLAKVLGEPGRADQQGGEQRRDRASPVGARRTVHGPGNALRGAPGLDSDHGGRFRSAGDG